MPLVPITRRDSLMSHTTSVWGSLDNNKLSRALHEQQEPFVTHLCFVTLKIEETTQKHPLANAFSLKACGGFR